MVEQEEQEEKIEISKTEQKKRAQKVLSEAKKIASMTLKQLEILDLPEQIKDEFKKLHKIKSHQARDRQVRYIAKLLRG